MNNLEKELCEVMHDFVEKHIEEVARNLSLRGHTWDYLGAKNEDDLLDQIKSTPDIAAWALTELCSWGMDKNYCKELFTEEDDVYKINNYLFSFDAYEGIITEVNKNYLWIARDADNSLNCFIEKPKLNAAGWYASYMMIIPKEFYPEVTFENSPKKLKL